MYWKLKPNISINTIKNLIQDEPTSILEFTILVHCCQMVHFEEDMHKDIPNINILIFL